MIYMEGGGKGRDTKVALRQGMDAFLTELKEAVRAKAMRWRLVCCGSRDEAFKAFSHAHGTGDMAITVLLVDAEGPVNRPARAHLLATDGWDLSRVDDDVVHLMVQTMEAWIVADPEALAVYYGQHFGRKALPRRRNLKQNAKATVTAALERATRATQKGTYHTIRHASDLLKLIDPQKVRQRCPNCTRLFDTLGNAIAGA